MKTLTTFIVAFLATCAIEAENSIITYKAKYKLSSDINIRAFNVPILTHTFSDGAGTIVFDGELKTIGDSAFYFASRLTSITLPEGITRIGNDAFLSCNSLESLTIPSTVTSLGDGFAFCSNLSSITVKTGNTHYASQDGVLFNYAKDTLIQYPQNKSQTAYVIPNTVVHIKEMAFMHCSYLVNVTLPDNLKSMERYAFGYCSKLSSISMPNSVTSIGDFAFSECTALSSVSLSKNITDMGYDVFCECTSLPIENNVRYADTYLVGATTKTLSSYTIKEGTKWVGNKAFNGCSNITSLSVPNSVVAFFSDAFNNCTSLNSINLPEGLTTIQNYAFGSCISLSAITLPNSLTSIWPNAFYNCTSLTTITIPQNLSSIGSTAFGSCSHITDFFVNANNTHYASENGVLFSYHKDTLIQYPLGNIRTAYTIPDHVSCIKEQAFYMCSNLSSITISDGVQSIMNLAFGYCSALSTINIPSSVNQIGYNLFVNCVSLPIIDNIRYADTYLVEATDKNLTTYTIKEGTRWMGEYAFSRCSTLTSITIPETMEYIGANAFYKCQKIVSITIPNKVSVIGINAFDGTKNVTYSGSATGAPWGALFVNANVDGEWIYNDITKTELYICLPSVKGDVTLCESVTKIHENAFADCSAITSITIPESVTQMGYGLFKGCTSLQSITCKAIEPPVCKKGCFGGWGKDVKRVAYVPAGSVEAYKDAYQWEDLDYILPIPDSNPTTNSAISCTDIYDGSFIRNGQLMILRDGKIFNAQGLEIR